MPRHYRVTPLNDAADPPFVLSWDELRISTGDPIDDDDFARALARLRIGESLISGGGAAPAYRVTRIKPKEGAKPQ